MAWQGHHEILTVIQAVHSEIATVIALLLEAAEVARHDQDQIVGQEVHPVHSAGRKTTLVVD